MGRTRRRSLHVAMPPQVAAARTGVDGLELVASDGRRLMLLVAGG
ncbi:hypothetical protein QWZ10_25355 [Paracoccus cavernae]|uniref:Uncharacterized protein n=1 Tax=Paracoccus cavernae TaxID=1571207 RepID=A0ABT8DH61_9RHOB|nr:hypothetical protein [Paracoccus cavernae]